MMKNVAFLVLLLLCQFSGFAQNKDKDKKKSKSNSQCGPNYKLLEDRKGQNAKMGDHMVAHLKFVNEKDTFNTYLRGTPITILLKHEFIGCLEDGLTNASKGDSIAILVSNDSLYTKLFIINSLPPEIKPGSFSEFHLRVIEIYSNNEFEKIQRKKTDDRIISRNEWTQKIIDSFKVEINEDDAKIISYLSLKKLDAQKTKSGIYLVINKEGKGRKLTQGDSISLHFIGTFLDGKEFNRSLGEQPLVFQSGVGNVIPGFDEAVLQLKKGSKATIIIPSPLAYGLEGYKDLSIPPNAPLVFDIEVLFIHKRKK